MSIESVPAVSRGCLAFGFDAATPPAVRANRSRIRAATAADAVPIAQLHERVWNANGSVRVDKVRSYAAHFRQVYLENPWYDPRIAPLVHEEDDGQITALLGVVARPMLCQGRRVRMAVTSELAVDPLRRNSLIAVQLLQRCLNGPQDLTVADGANDCSRRLLERLGARAMPLYSLHFARPLRPVANALWLAGRRALLRPVCNLARPLAAPLDAILHRIPDNPLRVPITAGSTRPMQPADLGDLYSRLGHEGLVPDATVDQVAWVCRRIDTMRGAGPTHAVAVNAPDGAVIGAFVYRIAGGAAELIQMLAATGAATDVWHHLLQHAHQAGAHVLVGRLPPRDLIQVNDRYCIFHRRGPVALVHSSQPDLLDCFLRGEASLSGLEGERSLAYFAR